MASPRAPLTLGELGAGVNCRQLRHRLAAAERVERARQPAQAAREPSPAQGGETE